MGHIASLVSTAFILAVVGGISYLIWTFLGLAGAAIFAVFTIGTVAVTRKLFGGGSDGAAQRSVRRKSKGARGGDR